MMVSLALIGKNISHSKSKEIYEGLLGQTIDYKIIDVTNKNELPCLDSVFRSAQGLSITSPYKQAYLKQVKVNSEILKLNSINAIRSVGNGNYQGTNTDYYALREIFAAIFNQGKKMNTHILGSGVMSKVTSLVLEELSLPYDIHSRESCENLSRIDLRAKNEYPTIIINCCSRDFVFNGMLDPQALFYDYNYNFTPHFNFFKNNSAQYVDGIGLLRRQAEYALDFFEIQKAKDLKW